jgi:hypothetical protein
MTCSGFSKVIGVKTKEETGYFELTKNWHTLFD